MTASASRGPLEVAIIGAGIVGLSTARALMRGGIRRLVVLEAEDSMGAHQSSHNSGVIHSGLYYRPGSLKARNCIAGREAMYRYCEETGIPHRRSGKLVVATRESELPALEELRRRGEANGLQGLSLLDRGALRELEPEVDAIAGLWIREAGIVDYGAVTASFGRDVAAAGGEVRTNARVLDVVHRDGAVHLVTAGGDLSARVVVNCAGLQSDRVARMCGVEPGLKIVPFRGEYYELTPGARGLVRNPIYPVPDPAFPFLGVHLTPTINGGVEAGPNAVLAFSREGYRKSNLSIRDLAETLRYRGFQRLARRHWRAGVAEMIRSVSRTRFVRDLRRLVPALSTEDVVPGKSGVRAQAVDGDGNLLDDFRILYGERTIHVLNAPSPAATASISIGEEIAGRVVETGATAASA